MVSPAIAQQVETLPRLIEQASADLAKATTFAQVLEAGDKMAFVYDAAKRAARIAKAMEAHDEIITRCRNAMRDALRIEARARIRLAEEYDAAQARGEVAKHSSGNPQIVPKQNDLPPTAADLGLDRKVILVARRLRDAEKAQPGILEKTLAPADEPTRALLKRAVDNVLEPPKPEKKPEIAKALAVVTQSATVTPREVNNCCAFCGWDFGEYLGDDDTIPLDLYLNEDEDTAICFDCAKEAYIVLERSRRRAAEAKAKQQTKKQRD